MPGSYREYSPPAGLSALVACLWEQRTDLPHTQRIIPDGCVDLIWIGEHELAVAGADTGPRLVELPAGARVAGVRLRPGAAGSVLGVPASEICDLQVDARDIWGARLTGLTDLSGPDRLARLVDAVGVPRAEPDTLVAAAARLLSESGAQVAAVADQLGVTERTLHRRTRTAIGYGPKMLARVARLRRLIALGSDARLARRALDAGYASQAHMNEEVRRLTGFTPVRFLKDATLTAG